MTGRTGTGSGASTCPVPVASSTWPERTTSPPARRTPPSTTASTRAWRIVPPARWNAVLSAATIRRGSTEWSEGMSSASRTVGASAGSARRAWLGRSRSTSRPSSRRNASSRSSASASSRSRATSSVPDVRWPTSPPSSAQKSAKPRAARSPSSTAAASPTCASATGASMPAATCQAPGSPASSTTVRSPRPAARHAQARPIAPPPATARSYVLEVTARHFLPTPALPGSGSTVGGRSPPSQPIVRAPVATDGSCQTQRG